MPRMGERRFFGLVGLVAVSLEWLLMRTYYFVQATWEQSFRISGNLPAWWIITGLFNILGYVAIGGSLLLLSRRYYKPQLTPMLLSLLIDAGATVVLWTLSTILEDAYVRGCLANSGLRYLSTLLFWGGIVWLLIGVARLRLWSAFGEEIQRRGEAQS